jgi:hypothetical protein
MEAKKKEYPNPRFISVEDEEAYGKSPVRWPRAMKGPFSVACRSGPLIWLFVSVVRSSGN